MSIFLTQQKEEVLAAISTMSVFKKIHVLNNIQQMYY